MIKHFLIISLLFIGCSGEEKSAEEPVTKSPLVVEQKLKDSKGINSGVKVYYFHGRNRCYSCNLIETYTREAVLTTFPNEIEARELSYESINVDEASHSRYIQQYGLYGQSVILSLQKNGEEISWKNLQQVWQLTRNQERFNNYIVGEVRSALAETVQ